MTTRPIVPASQVADDWEAWCGETQWTKKLREFGSLGGLVRWWSGYPQSRSAIPLTFELFLADGTKCECEYRLKDIRAAIELARQPAT